MDDESAESDDDTGGSDAYESLLNAIAQDLSVFLNVFRPRKAIQRGKNVTSTKV